ncbi:molecular chaperone DnaK suppressor DksA [Catellatospora sp. TT07R-123]|uniref:TraR/DksA family transcriptional regulator n=1 Tax=Catellatospora sp. TT07R-123 TaxID=2733863 RepID=UPI001B2C5E9F|nr:TraR/DksA C4-type zinc finger protein [Catellatospora sp. TT07R-123]GHJ43542.1 molecular chaperone DnaK suppressor DksA [Catellatospora sp. TT07R-123]
MSVLVEEISMADLGRLLQERYEQAAENVRLEAQVRSELTAGQFGPGDVADAGSLASESAQQELVSAALQEQLDRLDAALRRWEDGTLGTCESCDSQIPAGRLEIMPWATHCVPCQRTQSGRH